MAAATFGSTHFPETDSQVFRFDVTNTGSTTNTYTFTRTCPGLICTAPDSVILAADSTTQVTVGYETTLATGSFAIRLTANGSGGGGTSDVGSGSVTVIPVDFVVELAADTAITVPSNTPDLQTSFRVVNESTTERRTYFLECVAGPDSFLYKFWSPLFVSPFVIFDAFKVGLHKLVDRVDLPNRVAQFFQMGLNLLSVAFSFFWCADIDK